MKTSAVLLGIVLVFAPTLLRAEIATELEPGTPPLTRAMFEDFAGLLEWLLQAPFTEDQKAQVEHFVRAAWRENRRADVDGVGDSMALRAKLAALTAAEREAGRLQVVDGLMREARADPENPLAALLVQLYDKAHAAIAPGTPPLTQQAVDASIEMLCFAASHAAGAKVTVSAADRRELGKRFAASYAGLPQETRVMFASMPAQWAALRVRWPKASIEERNTQIASWRADGTLVALGRQLAGKPADSAKERELTLLQRQKKALRDEENYTLLANIMASQHRTKMNIINSMNPHYRYEYRW